MARPPGVPVKQSFRQLHARKRVRTMHHQAVQLLSKTGAQVDDWVRDRVQAVAPGLALPAKEVPPFEQRAHRPDTWRETMLQELRLVRCDRELGQLSAQIILHLDDKGFLTTPLEQLGEELRSERLEDARELVRSLDPPGCGASSAAEYLAWEVAIMWPEDPFFPELVRRFLPDLQAGVWSRAAKELDIDPEDVEEYRDMLAGLRPWPTWGVDHGEIHHVAADYRVVFDQGWRVVPTDERSHEQLHALLRSAELTGEQGRELRDVVQSLEVRHNTVDSLVERIVFVQRPFFERGIEHLRAMSQAEVAKELGVDDSWVSRAANAKFVETPAGVLPLSFFFNSGVETRHGYRLAAPAVQARLCAMVEGEDAAKPWSDQELANSLDVQGICCSRRTVAKYRALAGIPPKDQRRKS